MDFVASTVGQSVTHGSYQPRSFCQSMAGMSLPVGKLDRRPGRMAYNNLGEGWMGLGAAAVILHQCASLTITACHALDSVLVSALPLQRRSSTLTCCPGSGWPPATKTSSSLSAAVTTCATLEP